MRSLAKPLERRWLTCTTRAQVSPVRELRITCGAVCAAVCTWMAVTLTAPAQAAKALPATASWWGTVTYVVDGDSLWIRPDGWAGKPTRIRLAEVDAPEICQRMGAQAKAQLSARVHQRHVFVQVHAHDGYGRAIATVTHDAQDLGQWLAQNGWAWSPGFRRAPGRYAQEMARAQQARMGVFADAAPQLPANFRRAHGPCKT